MSRPWSSNLGTGAEGSALDKIGNGDLVSQSMATFKTFYKTEDAYVVASLLESAGIEATVIEDSAYGGGLLGGTGASIRIEVPDSQLKQAQEVVDSAQAVETEVEKKIEARPDTKLQQIFRRLVVIDVVVYAIIIVLPDWLYHTPPAESETAYWLYALTPSLDLLYAFSMLWIPVLLMGLIASVLLFFYLRIGRWLYVGFIGWHLLSHFAYPPVILTSPGGFLSAVSWMLASAIITLMFVPEVAGRFRKRVGESA